MGSHEHGEGATDADFDRVTQAHHEFLQSYVGRGGVVPSESVFRKARYGEDSIIAHLDTGVWPESPSFSDEGMGPIPSRWKGICQHDMTGFRCNRKLIGARYFNKGYLADSGSEVKFNNTVRDYEGHGSHTLSTIGGNFVPGASVFGYGNGTAQGGSPKARGASLAKAMPEKKLYPLINAADAKLANEPVENATLCLRGTIDPKKAGGKILVCLRGINARMEKSLVALDAGAVGMILCNDEPSGNDLVADPHLLPASQLTYKDGLAIYAYMNSTETPLGYIEPPETELGIKPAPIMAAFSSRGPNTVTPEILKWFTNGAAEGQERKRRR
ncbi:Subtilisin-like protease [Vigna angularis]|uniref:Subtilisin-like protease n=1 Tax=Phaseolus angularis TaxID=3914 RepID=A0A8T0L2S9_PHAAN|nr:Subtilisin-like protease [Vigna angularis]